MNITQIKSKLNVETLELNTSNDAAGVKTDWLRHWDNDRRIAVSIHKDLLAQIKDNSEISSLGLQTESREGSKGSYQSYRIVRYKAAEVTI